MKIRTNRGETGFYLACYHLTEHAEVRSAFCIHTLYHAGCDINARTNLGYTALHLAAAFGHTSLVLWLINKKANHRIKPYPQNLANKFGKLGSALF